MALVWAGCREPTQVTLHISTDVPCAEVVATSIAVGRLGGIEAKDAAAHTSSCKNGRIGTLVVVPSGSDDTEVAVRVVTGLGPTPEQCAESGYHGGCIVARRALRFIPHEPIDLPIEMSAACRDVACSPKDTCVDGVCVSAVISDPTTCTEPNQCQPVDAGADASSDVLDAPTNDATDAAEIDAAETDAGELDVSGDEGEGGSSCVSPIAGGSCDTFAQCGCGPKETCSVVGDTTVCVAAGNGKLDEKCATTELCSPGLDCFYWQTAPGACKKYCRTDADCGGGSSRCSAVTDSKGQPITGVGFCTSGCALESPAITCGPLGCVLVQKNATDCQPVGTGIGPGACTTSFDCAVGYGCDNGTDCRKWCRVGKNECGDAGVCTAANVVVNGIAYGVCL